MTEYQEMIRRFIEVSEEILRTTSSGTRQATLRRANARGRLRFVVEEARWLLHEDRVPVLGQASSTDEVSVGVEPATDTPDHSWDCSKHPRFA